jgi:uncharacterized cupin superfamily protein
MAWIGRPSTTGAGDLMVAEVEFGVRGFHDFHHHPGQEEVLYVLAGRVEQWVDREMRVLGPGDSASDATSSTHRSMSRTAHDASSSSSARVCRRTATWRSRLPKRSPGATFGRP